MDIHQALRNIKKKKKTITRGRMLTSNDLDKIMNGSSNKNIYCEY